MSKVLAVLLLVGILALLWWAISSDVFRGSYKQAENIYQQVQTFTSPTGDRIQINTVLPPEPRRTELLSDVGTRTRSNSNSSIIEPNSTLSANAEQSYGHTTQYSNAPSGDVYQIGNPVTISGKLLKVIPDSCKIIDGQQKCEFISPAKFKYLFYVTCEFRDFCSTEDISRWDWTDNDGNFKQIVQTPSSSFTSGMYRVDILANSEVKDPSGRPYEVKAQYYFKMIGS